MKASNLVRPLSALLAAFLFLTVTVAAEQQIPQRGCGTGPPSPELHDAHMKLHKGTHRIRGRTALANATNTTQNNSPIDVKVFFHVVSTNDQKNLVNKTMIYQQFANLSNAYYPYNIFFRFGGMDFSVNDAWATDADDAGMKRALRNGTYADLNIYLQTNLSSPSSIPGAPGTMLLGYCSLPATWVTATTPAQYYVQDGCNVLAGSLPGGNVYGYTQGMTAVHEVGHWFGLLHTFQDYTCDPTDQGDLIADTPQQSTATSGCPTVKDSCPGSSGLDAVHNYMDYSSDRCYTGFTPLQRDRMHTMFTNYRAGK